jgi:geranylgeranyl reductase family protein
MATIDKNHFDVVIVGAGPAGATLGYELAKRGTDVLILEKEPLPRYKACAGVISMKTVDLLGCDISSVTHQVISGARVTYKLRKEFVKNYHSPIGHMVMRDEFDQFLVSRAQDTGALVADNQRVCSLYANDSRVNISTMWDTFTCKIVVGADGATSVVGKTFGLANGRQLGVAMEAEVASSEEDMIRWNSLAGIDIGSVKGGYGWVFPKRGLLSVGVGAPIQRARLLRAYHQRLLKSLNLQNCKVERFKSHLIPTFEPGTAIQKGRVLVVGDAAGLIDPLSGEGIPNAIKSAQLASPVIANQLTSPSIDLQEYQQAVEDEMLPELRIARRMHMFFTWLPHVSFLALQKSDHVWRGSCGIASGRHTYADIRKRLGLFRFLLGT